MKGTYFFLPRQQKKKVQSHTSNRSDLKGGKAACIKNTYKRKQDKA